MDDKILKILFLISLSFPSLSFAEPGKGFGLEEALRLSLENNFEIKAAKEQLKKQNHVILEAYSVYFPTLAIEGKVDTIDQNRIPAFNSTKFGSTDFWTIDLKLRQSLYSGGRGDANLQKQKYLEEASTHELSSTISKVTLEVIEKFYNVLLSRAEIEVQKQNVSLLEEQLKNEKNRFAAGSVSNFNVLRAEVALANSKIPLIKAKNNLKLAQQDLLRVLGVSLEAEQEVLGELLYQEPPTISIKEALKEAKENRSELKQLTVLVNAAKAGISFEQGNYFPSLELFANYGADKSRFSDNFSDEVHGWYTGAELKWNIFNGLKTKADVDQAKSDFSLAEIALSQAQQNINIEVRSNYFSLEETKELVNASSQVIKQAEESLRLAQSRQLAGSGTQLETLDTQVALTQARTNYIQALFNYNLSLARLKKSIGRLAKSKV